MKIAALSPQFIIEEPAGEKTVDEKGTARKLAQVRLVEAIGVESTASDEANLLSDEEREERAREALKHNLERLSERFRNKLAQQAQAAEQAAGQEADVQAAVQAGGPSLDPKRRQALALYQDIEARRDPSKERGDLVNKVY